MPLSDDQIREFHDRGFIVIKGFFDAAVVGEVSAILDDLRDREPEPGREAKYYEESDLTGENILVRIENVVGENNPDLTETLINEKTLESLTQLFGEAPLLFKEKVNYKMPGCRSDQLHQDQAAGWNRYADFFITMAIAVDPNREENAAISFMSSGNYEKTIIGEEWKPLTQADPPYEPAGEYTMIEADPGDVIFFDSYVPHGSPPNTSNRSRRNIFLTFNRESAGDQRAQYYADKWKSYAPNKADEARTADSFRV